MRRFLHHNGLSVAVFGLFLVFVVAERIAGFKAHNEERKDHDPPPVGYLAFLTCGECIESTTENWESAFWEMAAYVIFTARLFQKGSAESKPVAAPHAQTGKD